jgi:hypothetical protein
MAKGMNWGIFSLLAVIVMVLGGIAAFFIYLARRAATAPLLESARAPVSPRRSASVLGRGGFRKHWALATSPRVGRVRHSCARGAGPAGSIAFPGNRTSGSASTHPIL